MTGALIILAVTVFTGILLWLLDLRRRKNQSADTAEEETAPDAQEGCCGQHIVCEKTTLSPIDPEIIYYDDEELDRFSGRDAESYSEEEKEELREVLYTLMHSDVAGWARSIQLRGIALPSDVRDELFMIVDELRHK